MAKPTLVTVINRSRQRLLIPGHGLLEPGEEPVELPDGNVVQELLAVGALEAPAGKRVEGHQGDALAALTVAQLREYAAERGIELDAATKKPEILELIEAAGNNPNEEEQ